MTAGAIPERERRVRGRMRGERTRKRQKETERDRKNRKRQKETERDSEIRQERGRDFNLKYEL